MSTANPIEPTGGVGLPPVSAPSEVPVPVATIALYSAPIAVVLFAVSLISFYFLKFATDILLVAPAAAGTILLIGRLWDAINDPLIGRLSDRTRTRWGRRRPWFAASAIPLALCVAALWGPPADLEGRPLFLWLLVSFLLFLTFFSTFRVPHLALGAELARGYHDRTRVFGGAQIFESVGLIAAAATIGLIEGAADPRAMAARLAIGIAVAIVVVLFVSTALMREREDFQTPDPSSSLQVFRDVLSNPHARVLLGVFFFDQMGFTTVIASLPYLSDYVLQSRGQTALYMAAAVISLMLSIPVWIVLSRRFGKRRVWVAALILKIAALGALSLLPTGVEYGARWLLFGVVAVGLLSGPTTVLGPSLKADVIDWDESQSGARREGAYFATWNFAAKSATAFAGWVLGMSLAATGFIANADQSETALFGIRAMSTLWPAALHTVALLCLGAFALDESAHRSAQLQAEERRQAPGAEPR